MYKTIVVTDQHDCPLEGLKVISFDQYVADYPKLGEPRTRIINLCDTEFYLSRGYYCSLLAESRQHKVLPSVNTINDLRMLDLDSEMPELTLAAAAQLEAPIELLIYFGWTPLAEWAKVVRNIFEHYPSPILKISLKPEKKSVSTKIERISLIKLTPDELELFYSRLIIFTDQVWRSPHKRKHRWDMAILYNPEEANAPSNPEAIKRFIKAANKVGIQADLVRSDQLKQLSYYDALFIRETTNIDHATYRLARRGEAEGLVVMDDSTSILRCCNKIFLHDAFTYNGISAPKTLIVSSHSQAEIERIESELDYPMVLKMPDSSFSVGVYKVSCQDELRDKLKLMLADSALTLVQEFLFTEFDWRIGVLNGRAIYACKYYMARNHWQIYNHENTSKRYQSGNFETLPTFEVPHSILKIALKACSIIGRGLYGVDIKQIGGQAYVIEVNDNPSIDHHIEDKYIGDELYMIIMQEFADRLEKRGRS